MNEKKQFHQDIWLTNEELQTAFQAVFRDSIKQPGFYYWDFGNLIDSKTFRQNMVDLKNSLSRLCKLHLNRRLNYQSVGRFNHQHSSLFHRDNGNPNSFLMLGYEPTKVDSKVYVADYSKYIEEEDISLEIFFEGERDINLIKNNNVLAPFVTELKPFQKENYRLLLLNNSKSFDDKSYGIFHSAEIPQMIVGEDRVLNYVMMQLCDNDVEELYNQKKIKDFINTVKIDR